MTTTNSPAATEAADTGGRLARLRDRLAPAVRQARSILWVLIAGGIGLIAGGLVAYVMLHSGTFAAPPVRDLVRPAAADVALLAFMVAWNSPLVWRWARDQRALTRDES